MSAPFPSSLSASRIKDKVAWVFDAEGKRNIWVAEPPDYGGKPITTFTKDDGQDLTELQWTPDAEKIVYVRGGAANGAGEYPNPISDPAGEEQGVWVISSSGGEPKRLGEGAAPAISPLNHRVAFTAKGKIWAAPLDGSSEAKQLLKTRGQCGSLRWSPDGSMLAFVSNRGDHSFVGVFDVNQKTVRYLDPGVDRDAEPAWSPDGKRIAFIRVARIKNTVIFTPEREALEPWSIRVADATTGEGHEIWKADKGRGSVFHEIVADNQIFWADSDRIIFPWEHDGWTHLYSVGTKGGRTSQLTEGNFEVEHVSISRNKDFLFYSANSPEPLAIGAAEIKEDVDRRHLWKVSAITGDNTRITSGEGIEWSPAPLADTIGGVAFLRSDARTPARPAIITGESKPRDLAPNAIPPSFPSDALVVPGQVTFATSDGIQLHGQLFLPQNIAKGDRRPAMIYFHGGSRRQMLLGFHYSSYYHNCYSMNQYLASKGYVVLAVNYRSGTGYGLEFREALNYGADGASEFNDVMGAGLCLRGRADVDPDRIGLWGGSYGGYLTALGLARASDLFAAGVDLHGVHDWNVAIKNFVASYDPKERPDFARRAFESSPLASVDTWRSPVLLIHGDDDRNVPFSQSVDLAEALRKQGVHFETLVFPDEIHGFLTHARWLQAFNAADRFLQKQLWEKKEKGGGKPPAK